MKQNNKIAQCPPAEDLVSMLVDNEGGSDDIRSMQRHVKTCERCSSLLQEFNTAGKLVKQHKPDPVHLSPAFTAQVMDEVYGYGEMGVLEDIIGLSRKVVASITTVVLILLAIMLFPEDGAIDRIIVDELVITNGVESEVLEKEEITYDDVVSLLLTSQ